MSQAVKEKSRRSSPLALKRGDGKLIASQLGVLEENLSALHADLLALERRMKVLETSPYMGNRKEAERKHLALIAGNPGIALYPE